MSYLDLAVVFLANPSAPVFYTKALAIAEMEANQNRSCGQKNKCAATWNALFPTKGMDLILELIATL